ncbi:metal-dependent hydrolase [Aquabacterium olei]|uniref:Metal-dependent hydrolase n=1 Tax=Aquabacterium olei TaxID=1296669 RepID=A0A2U8FSX9_9BURK|nr:M48 family metallopeptidase [Aquabacterium olei]AWI54120.1 metal-dependent hydrolase [Aquabacterium olei]
MSRVVHLAPPPVQSAVLRYLGGYPAQLLAQAQELIDAGRLGAVLQKRYPDHHEVRTDKLLYEHVMALKQQYLRSSEPLSKVAYDGQIQVIQQALGTHTVASRVQGGKLKAKREIRVASLFKDTPPEFLQMIVVHELAHLKEKAHDKAFYALCCHMEPAYHQYEFDLRLWLTARDIGQLTA